MLSFAIGDIHGCYDKLVGLVGQCMAYRPAETRRFIFIGDYVDRGPNSSEVIEFLINLQHEADISAVFLRGNHEQMLLEAAASPERELGWYSNGGDTTLSSYGIARASQLPANHLGWLRALPMSFDDGQRLFVHAGIDPSRPLSEQRPKDLLWIRDRFLSSNTEFSRLIVHGHSPTENGRPDIRLNRINIDTGAVYGNQLTAAVFSGARAGPIEFLWA